MALQGYRIPTIMHLSVHESHEKKTENNKHPTSFDDRFARLDFLEL